MKTPINPLKLVKKQIADRNNKSYDKSVNQQGRTTIDRTKTVID